MTFDPRTLPGKDFTFSLACMLWYGALLADCLTTRWGIWYSGFSEGNKIMKWFTDKNHVFRTFIDGGLLRPGIVFAFLQACQWGGFMDKAHAYLPIVLAVATAVLPIRNYLKIRKMK